MTSRFQAYILIPQPVVGALCDLAHFLGEHDGPQKLDDKQKAIRGLFAELINAEPDEIALVPSTVLAENFVMNSLSLSESGKSIITDALHFSGSLDLYRQLISLGRPVSILSARKNRIDYDELHAEIRKGRAGLVAVSSVSHRNGFEHDLRTVCELAHAHGALVFADVIQHAGALPLDVKASGVDFCACASYKWLLGDLGLGFLYVRRDRWPLLNRTLFGPRQQGQLAHDKLLDPSGHFHIGTLSGSATEALFHSLPHTIAFMRAQPDKTWQPLTQRIEQRFTALGLTPLTPAKTRAPIRSYEDRRITKVALERLRARGVRIAGSNGFIRLSPSVFNTLEQVDRAADALSEVLAETGA
jgi:selenocysteine lyase/cysteine desulfurase